MERHILTTSSLTRGIVGGGNGRRWHVSKGGVGMGAEDVEILAAVRIRERPGEENDEGENNAATQREQLAPKEAALSKELDMSNSLLNPLVAPRSGVSERTRAQDSVRANRPEGDGLE